MEDNNELFAEPTAEYQEEKTKKLTLDEKLEATKEEIKEIRQKIKVLKENKDKTESVKAELKKLKVDLSDLTVLKGELQTKIINAKNKAKNRADKKRNLDLKNAGMIDVLRAEGFKKENEVKGLIALRRTTLKYGIKTNNKLVTCLEFVKQNAPHLLDDDQ